MDLDFMVGTKNMRGFAIVCFIAGGGCTTDTGNTPAGPDMAMTVFPMGCSSGAKDGDETDIDCGGPCAPCGTDQACVKGTDCQSTFCTNKLCAAPSCGDTAKNGKETDVDCGGGGCPGCDNGKVCGDGTDCKSMTCTNGTCAPTPCSNGVKDGLETDVDCGGGTCGKCPDGKMCGDGTDCLGGTCTNMACKSVPMCGAGTADCDGNPGNGCEVNTQTDAKNCGGCGKTCQMNAPFCRDGVCKAITIMSWSDKNSADCTGTISTEIQKIADAMPQVPVSVTISATQVMPQANYGNWTATFPNTTCVRKWLSAWAARDLIDYDNWRPGVCQATDQQGTAYIFVLMNAAGAPLVAIYPAAAADGQYKKIYMLDRQGAWCDLVGVNDRPGFEQEKTNTNPTGQVGDSLVFSW